MDDQTHDQWGNPKQTFHIVRTRNAKGDVHKVGAPAEIIDGETVRQVLYKQNGECHRTNGPNNFLIDKATGVVFFQEWGIKRTLHRDNGPARTARDRQTGVLTLQEWAQHGNYNDETPNPQNPWKELRLDPTTGTVQATWNRAPASAHERLHWEGLLHSAHTPWHQDPDFLAQPDKPKKADYENVSHTKAEGFFCHFAAERNRIDITKEVPHRDGNLPALVERNHGNLAETFYIDGQQKRTDGGPTEVQRFAPKSWSGVEGKEGLFVQRWHAPCENQGVVFDGLHRQDGPAEIILHHDGTITEKWGRNGLPHTPTAHDLLVWERVKAEQGGPLWVPPEHRSQVGDCTRQVLVDSDTGVQWYEATRNNAGLLHKPGHAPSLAIRDPRTGTPLLEAHHDNGLPHREGAPSVRKFDPMTGDLRQQEWHARGIPYNPNGPILQEERPNGEVLQVFSEDGKPRSLLIHKPTGIVVREMDTRLDGTGRPSITKRDPETGEVCHQEWRNAQGKPDRADGPARISVFETWNGAKQVEQLWARDGKIHEPTPEQNIRWGAIQRQQGSLFTTGATQPERTGGVKAAALAAAEAAAKPKAKATDRGDER